MNNEAINRAHTLRNFQVQPNDGRYSYVSMNTGSDQKMNVKDDSHIYELDERPIYDWINENRKQI